MKKTTQVSLIIFLVLVFCTNEDTSVNDTLENQESNEEIEPLNYTEPEQGSQAEETSQQEEVKTTAEAPSFDDDIFTSPVESTSNPLVPASIFIPPAVVLATIFIASA